MFGVHRTDSSLRVTHAPCSSCCLIDVDARDDLTRLLENDLVPCMQLLMDFHSRPIIMQACMHERTRLFVQLPARIGMANSAMRTCSRQLVAMQRLPIDRKSTRLNSSHVK